MYDPPSWPVFAGLALTLFAPGLRAQEAHPDPDWLNSTRARLALGEYAFEASEDGLTAPNRAQALRSHITPRGLRVHPRDPRPSRGAVAGAVLETADAARTQGTSETRESRASEWSLTIRTVALGRGDARTPVAPGSLSSAAERVELDHGSLVEWFENRPGGIEQGWTVDAPPVGAPGEDGDLVVSLEIEGPFRLRRDGDGRGGVLVHDTLDVELPYRGLVAFDATGRWLPASMEAAPDGILIRVDDRSAEYPVTIDPLLEHLGWSREANQSGARLGMKVAGIGDVNADGFADFAIAAPNYDGGVSDEGRVWVYHGSPNGPVGPVWIMEGNQTGALYGRSVDCAGDVNGDGYDDVIVGVPGWTGGQADEGRVLVYAGGPGGLAGSPSFSAESNQTSAQYGARVAGIGDVNGDGFDDIAASAPTWTNGELNEGHVWTYHGSAAGIVTPAAFRAEGGQSGVRYGISLDGAGDVNGDGFDDLIVGGPGYSLGFIDRGRAWIYHGSSSGITGPAARRYDGTENGDFLGSSVAGIGDVNGDGFDDVAVGASGYDRLQSDLGGLDEGRVWVYHGTSGGADQTAAWSKTGDQQSAMFGSSLAGAGDVNGDGYDDLIVGAQLYSNGESHEGRVWLYLGSPDSLTFVDLWQDESNLVDALFGSSLAGIGDVNGDGFDDVLIGALGYTNQESSEGAVFFYEGTPDFGDPFCATAINSTGLPGAIHALGHPSASLGILQLVADDVPNTPGIFFHGSVQVFSTFGNGIRCVGGAVERGLLVHATGNQATYLYDNSVPRRSLVPFIGSTRHFQYWFRNASAGGAGFNTSDGVSVTLLP